MSDSESENGETDTKLAKLMSVARHPYAAATSKPAQRAYLGTAIAVAVTCLLLFTSSVAYILFYYNYVPDIGAEHVVYLQFGEGHPYGTVYLPKGLISQQPYDISVSMHLPRTSSNLATGNFMIDMALLTPSTPLLSPAELAQPSMGTATPANSAIMRSRRPAIMTHVSPLVETAHIVANLFWFIIGWKRESERLDVSMFEGISFARGQKNVPDRIQIVIEADAKMQFYDAAVRIRAEFSGLRWIMYNHRIFSFFFFSSTFFGVALVAAGAVYALIGMRDSSETEPKQQKIKSEFELDRPSDPLSTEDLSDTPRRFPAFGRQEPLVFSGHDGPSDEAHIKQEEDIEQTTGIPPLAMEADDEDEDDGTWRDSGIGTGRESDRRSIQRRRKSSRDERD